MPDEITIQPASTVTGAIRPPGSKSITNRALVCAALAAGESRLTGVLDSDDTRVMVDGLQKLGIRVDADWEQHHLRVFGCGGVIPRERADLFVGNSGTTIRFLTALCTLGNGVYRLDGVARMRERPIADLLGALGQLGAHAQSENENGNPPVMIQAAGLPGGTARIAGDISSQYLSGILMASPYAHDEVTLDVVGKLVSRPYVQMTQAVMAAFGATVRQEDDRRFSIPGGQCYRGRDYAIEPDASAASYFWSAAAVTGGTVTVQGLARDALQGDVRYCDCLAQMGCQVEYADNAITVRGGPLQGIDVDMNAISDTAQSLAAVALFATGTTRIRGIGHNRHKETDRIADLACELRKLGAHVNEFDDGFSVTPGPLHGAKIETYDDHRMAMSLAIAGLRIPDVTILNPACTAKTYPFFFRDLDQLVDGTPAT